MNRPTQPAAPSVSTNGMDITDRVILRATYGSRDHPLRIGDIEIPCYVLSDGTRVITQRGLLTSIGLSTSGGTTGAHRAARLVGSLRINIDDAEAKDPGMRDFSRQMDDLVLRISNPILFYPPSGRMLAYGFEATILADLCEAVLVARDRSALSKHHEKLVRQCEILIRGFARLGIIALVDEVTGYQEIRKKDDLQRILEAYIAPELLPWTLRFPEEFYRQLFRLRGWTFDPKSVKRPMLVSRLTVELVYERLPKGVLEELRERNPRVGANGARKYKHHQFLSEDIGDPHLERQVAIVIALMRASPNWQNFKRLVERACPNGKTQYEIDYEDSEAMQV